LKTIPIITEWLEAKKIRNSLLSVSVFHIQHCKNSHIQTPMKTYFRTKSMVKYPPSPE
jgi:hypothetical protein